MALRFGDVIVVPFPFTDQTTIKRRPAVVVSSERYNRERPDLILMAITSQARPTPTVGELAVVQWAGGGTAQAVGDQAAHPTIEAALVIRQLGALVADDQKARRQALVAVIG
jgi:mRNA interferase MazF